ncbi:MAG: hypothetical protein IPF99_32900 [Deltaproteobacteria bacterium]|nr:hypothetical protein [Deltaproteobacteria bacterium]
MRSSAKATARGDELASSADHRSAPSAALQRHSRPPWCIATEPPSGDTASERVTTLGDCHHERSSGAPRSGGRGEPSGRSYRCTRPGGELAARRVPARSRASCTTPSTGLKARVPRVNTARGAEDVSIGVVGTYAGHDVNPVVCGRP